MRIHILGIAGTFMAGIAMIARELGFEVEGSDQACYPPMSTLLSEAKITVFEGYQIDNFHNKPDLVIVGNVIKRGNPMLEYVLDNRLPFTSGPAWLAEQVLRKKQVLAIAGTHGKTTTSSMLAWILEHAGLNPSYLIGGRPGMFQQSARLTDSDFFVIEADEYDSAFFDKRSKFIHYLPKTFVFNNLEFDHADIFDNLEAIKKQFHHVIRTVPKSGTIIIPDNDQAINDTLDMGCWTPTVTIGANQNADWSYQLEKSDGSAFSIYKGKNLIGSCNWNIWGEYNVQNALAATVAANSVGVEPHVALKALTQFVSSARRLDFKGEVNQIKVYEDFAHHPTAIQKTLAAIKAHYQNNRIIALLELGSYTMRTGVHQQTLPTCFINADQVHLLVPANQNWNVDALIKKIDKPSFGYEKSDELLEGVKQQARPGDIIVLMSNGSFDGVPSRITAVLAEPVLS